MCVRGGVGKETHKDLFHFIHPSIRRQVSFDGVKGGMQGHVLGKMIQLTWLDNDSRAPKQPIDHAIASRLASGGRVKVVSLAGG